MSVALVVYRVIGYSRPEPSKIAGAGDRIPRIPHVHTTGRRSAVSGQPRSVGLA